MQLTHLHEEEPHDERAALAVPHFFVVHRVRLEDVQKTLLAQPISLLEKGVFWKRSVQVSLDGSLMRRRFLHSEQEISKQTQTSATTSYQDNQQPRQPATKTTSNQDNQRPRQPATKTTSDQDNQRPRQPATKTTSDQDNQQPRQPATKTTSDQDNQRPRQPATKTTSDQDNQRPRQPVTKTTSDQDNQRPRQPATKTTPVLTDTQLRSGLVWHRQPCHSLWGEGKGLVFLATSCSVMS